MLPIKNYRKKIDALDQKILSLITQRGRVAQSIGRLKQKGEGVIYVPSREQKIFEQLAKQNKGPYQTESILSIFREIISATRSLESPLKVSYLGPVATFTHMAAVKHFGSSTQLIPASNIGIIFDEVERGYSDYGVVPIENSTEGVVSHTLDLFAGSQLRVCAEIVLKIYHHLLSVESDLKQIKTVYSHPHALAQCRRWLLAHLPKAKLKEVESTAMAAQKASEHRQTAAIASEVASGVYGIPIFKKKIQDQSQNFTRFLVIGNHDSQKTGRDKTSILFAIHDEVGSLHHILGTLARAGINLTKIESRPMKTKAWEYLFFVDVEGHYQEPAIKKAFDQIKKKCALFQILGSYPRSEVIV